MELWKHQIKAIKLAKEKKNFALFFDVGTGKTRTVLEIIRAKYNEDDIVPTIIISPLITLKNWKNEILKYTRIPESEILVLEGNGRIKTLQLLNSRSRIIILNYETLLIKSVFDLLLRFRVKILICDESQRLKNHRSKRAILTTQLADLATNRYILSGTPVLNSPMDLFSQFRILDGGKIFGKNFFSFRGKYFYDANGNMPAYIHFPNWKIRKDSIEKMNEAISKVSLSVKKSEALDLPPFVATTIGVGMTKEQGKMYEEMKKDYITFVSKNDIVVPSIAQLAITKALRLMQIASGFLKMEDGTIHRFKETPKQSALRELLSDKAESHKIIIWAVFKENYEQIREVCKSLALPYVEAHGEVTAKEKFKAVDDFNTDPNIRVFVGHPSSGGVGINLVCSDISVFYSRTFSLEQSLQAEARNYRGGSEIFDRVTRYDLVCEGTLEEKIQKSLAEKQNIGESLIRKHILEV